MAIDLVRTMRSQGMSDASLDQPATVRAVLEHLSVVGDAIKALTARVAEVEAKGVVYMGVWQAAQTYQRGNLATYAGGIWHANQETRDKPGDGKAWTLAVKGGDR